MTNTSLDKMIALTGSFTPAQLKGFEKRLKIKLDDRIRQRALLSMIDRESVVKRNGGDYSHLRNEESSDMMEIICLLSGEIARLREDLLCISKIKNN